MFRKMPKKILSLSELCYKRLRDRDDDYDDSRIYRLFEALYLELLYPECYSFDVPRDEVAQTLASFYPADKHENLPCLPVKITTVSGMRHLLKLEELYFGKTYLWMQKMHRKLGRTTYGGQIYPSVEDTELVSEDCNWMLNALCRTKLQNMTVRAWIDEKQNRQLQCVLYDGGNSPVRKQASFMQCSVGSLNLADKTLKYLFNTREICFNNEMAAGTVIRPYFGILRSFHDVLRMWEIQFKGEAPPLSLDKS